MYTDTSPWGERQRRSHEIEAVIINLGLMDPADCDMPQLNKLWYALNGLRARIDAAFKDHVDLAMAKDAAAKGAALLDQEHPGWHEKIDVSRLDMRDCGECVLGQLYGVYGTGLDALERKTGLPVWEERVEYGFTTGGPHRSSGILGAAWMSEINFRRVSS